MNDPRKPKVIIPQDADFMTVLQHKKKLEETQKDLEYFQQKVIDGLKKPEVKNG